MKVWHRFERNSTLAWYNVLNHDVIFTTDSSYQPNGLTDEIELKKIRNRLNRTEIINILYLILTEGCNMACSYCFFEGGFTQRPPINPMSIQTAKKAIDLFVRCIDKYDPNWDKVKMVNFYGGEPLLNSEVLIQSLDYLNTLKVNNKLPQTLRTSLVTNGTIMTPEIAKILADNEVEVGISIDGPSELHNQYRKTCSGKGTFDHAVKALKILQDHNVIVGISCTVTKELADRMPEIFQWFIDNFGITMMGFNPLLDSKGFSVNDPNYYFKVAKGMIECFKVSREQNVNVIEDRIMRKVKAFTQQYFYDRDCSACGRQITIGPNGKVGICHSFYGTGDYFVEMISDFNPFQHPFWKEWNRRIPLNMEKCCQCPALGICGGGCGFNAFVRHGSINEIDDTFCSHSLYTLEWLIWDLHKQMQ
ncbi:radical SAM protein [Patescibacteria group bacterium]|nr:radical SAM protein [Patescibacteria group bacterium]MBU2472779.1 radical SAM protein [Patescibacteria group bacterium]